MNKNNELNSAGFPHYKESNEKAGELLRMILPMFNAHKVIPTPLNYTVFYHHMNGSSKPLSETMNMMLSKPGEYTTEKGIELFNKYISTCNDNETEIRQQKLEEIVDETMGSIVQNGKLATESSEHLDTYIEKLQTDLSNDELKAVMQLLLADVSTVTNLTQDLSSNLQSSKKEMQKLKDELENAKKAAIIDPMTTVMNKAGFYRAFEELVSNENPHCLLVIDIDKFKNINDTHGHLVGDKVIKFLAKTLKNNFKGKDIVGRFGGDEFAILMPDITLEACQNVANQVRHEIERAQLKHSATGQLLGSITISVGISTFKKGDDCKTLFERADTALYESKQNGRNRVSIAA